MKKISRLLILTALAIGFSACKKNTTENSVPVLQTIEPGQQTAYTAESGGKSIVSSAEITGKGVCWTSSGGSPTIADSKTSDGTGIGGYSSHITGLQPNTHYTVRAYATNKYGTGYGSNSSFYTSRPPIFPSMTTSYARSLTRTSVVCGMEALYNGDATIDSTGLCWNTGGNPTKSDHTLYFAVPPTGFGNSYTTTINNLQHNTTYYIRAFATSSLGTGYGNAVKIKTFYSTVNDADGNSYYTVKIGNQEWMAENLRATHFRDGSSIPSVSSYSAWNSATQPAYVPYSNSAASQPAYGFLYNGYVASDSRNAAPTGWHVASSNDFETLWNYVGFDSVGYKIKVGGADYWDEDKGNNETGFSALGGGYYGGSYSSFGHSANFLLNDATPRHVIIYSFQRDISIEGGLDYTYGGNIRCVKD